MPETYPTATPERLHKLSDRAGHFRKVTQKEAQASDTVAVVCRYGKSKTLGFFLPADCGDSKHTTKTVNQTYKSITE